MYVPQNINTLFMAHLLAFQLIRLLYYNSDLRILYGSPHNAKFSSEFPPAGTAITRR